MKTELYEIVVTQNGATYTIDYAKSLNEAQFLRSYYDDNFPYYSSVEIVQKDFVRN